MPTEDARLVFRTMSELQSRLPRLCLRDSSIIKDALFDLAEAIIEHYCGSGEPSGAAGSDARQTTDEVALEEKG